MAKIIDTADIVMRFEKVLEETASVCGIPKKSLNFDPVELQSTIVNKSLSNGRNRNELLRFLCIAAKKSYPNYQQTDEFLVTFKVGMERALGSNEQPSNTKEIVTGSERPRSFMSDVVPPSSLSAINQEAIGYLR